MPPLTLGRYFLLGSNGVMIIVTTLAAKFCLGCKYECQTNGSCTISYAGGEEGRKAKRGFCVKDICIDRPTQCERDPGCQDCWNKRPGKDRYSYRYKRFG